MVWPAPTSLPAARLLSTGSKLLRRPLPWSMVMTGRSTTTPTKLTVPAAGEVTWTPSDADPRSTPRWPLSQGLGGGSKSRSTAGRGASGHLHDGAATVAETSVWGAEVEGGGPN